MELNSMSQFTPAWLAGYLARTGKTDGTSRTSLTKQGAAEREAELHEKIFDECRRRGWIALHGSMAERT